MAEQRLIIGFYPQASKEECLELHANLGAQFIQSIDELNAHVVTVPVKSHQTVVGRYRSCKYVRYIELDGKFHATGLCRIIPNDPNFNVQYGLPKIMAPEAWCISERSRTDVDIAILDSGVDSTHPDLAGKVTVSMNFTDSPDPDLFGHGTHVAGIAGADTNNGLFGAGISFNSCDLWNLKVLGDDGTGLFSWIANGILFAANNGADIINMSFGSTTDSNLVSDAVTFAFNQGLVLVASAGNDNSSDPNFPAAYPVVISVAATDVNDQKASFSNFGDGVDVAAPGDNIFSTLPTFPNSQGALNFGSLSGTSQASPLVGGLAGLIKATFPSLTNVQIRQAIESTTDDVPGSGVLYQFGRINALSALIEAAEL
ncbi:S8 family peptidase [Neobacillus niacini]|uniref:S8 family peptidase n=1 Tax=Neobacillus niacini TaxID=86668 RepID=UPI003983C9ED